MNELNVVYLSPGDVVMVRHNIENRPKMFVVEKVTRSVRNSDTKDFENMFLGMKCRWFDNNGNLQEGVFSTKDLVKVE